MSRAIKLSPYLKELRFHLCQNSQESSGIREFIQKHYVPIKKTNPLLPILIRECRNVEPKVIARYEFGKESSVSVKNFGSDKILDAIKRLASA